MRLQRIPQILQLVQMQRQMVQIPQQVLLMLKMQVQRSQSVQTQWQLVLQPLH